MSKHEVIRFNPRTGQREFVKSEEFRSSSASFNGVGKMVDHFSAQESLEQERLERIEAERVRLTAVREQQNQARIQQEKALEKRNLEQLRIRRQAQEERQKEHENDLAIAIKTNREKYLRYNR